MSSGGIYYDGGGIRRAEFLCSMAILLNSDVFFKILM
jgi:hypothetical protein